MKHEVCKGSGTAPLREINGIGYCIHCDTTVSIDRFACLYRHVDFTKIIPPTDGPTLMTHFLAAFELGLAMKAATLGPPIVRGRTVILDEDEGCPTPDWVTS